MAATAHTAPAGDSRSRRLARAVVTVVVWLAVLAAAWLLWPTSLGGSTTVILVSGSSMEPTYESGDVVVARTGTPEVGDIVVYNPEGYGDAKVIHRIVGGDGESGWEIRGDNNDFTDPFTPTDEAIVGVATLHLPKAGFAAMFIAKPWLWGSFLVLAAVLILWPSREREDAHDEDDDLGAAGGGAAVPDVDGEGGEPPLSGPERTVHAMIVAASTLVRDARRGRPRRLVGTASLVLATLLVSGAMTAVPQRADAAQLDLSASGVATAVQLTCGTASDLAATPAGAETAGGYEAVLIEGLPDSCAGKPITVTLRDASGGLVSSGSGTVSSPATQLSTGPYDPSDVAYVVVEIVAPILASWNYEAGGPFTDCTVTRTNSAEDDCEISLASQVATSQWSNGSSSGTYQTIQIQVSQSGSPQPVSWAAQIDLSQVPGVTVTVTEVSNDNSVTVSSCATLPVIQATGADYQFYATFYVGDLPPWFTPTCG